MLSGTPPNARGVAAMTGSPLRRYGGKTHMAKRRVGLLAPHTRFVEVFGGAGGVILTKVPSTDEV